jgi:hypothetical protein
MPVIPGITSNPERDWRFMSTTAIRPFSFLDDRRRLLTIKELGDFLNLKKTALYHKVRAGRIPYLLIDGSIRFDPQAIANWLRAHEVVSTDSCSQDEMGAAA